MDYSCDKRIYVIFFRRVNLKLRGPPLYYFEDPFLLTGPKIFQRRLRSQDILILRGDSAPKIRNFFDKIFLFWPVFFQNFACGPETLTKTGSL